MAGPKGSPRFEYSGWAVGSSTSITGTLGISGSLIVSGALGYYGSSENLVGLMSATTGNMRWFIDGTNGSDSNDGLTSATPKKNFRAITASIPDLIKHNCVLHLTGSVVDSVAMNLYRYVDTGVTFLIDGGPVLTYTLDDGAGGGIVSTATTTGSITVAGAAYAVDLYAGWYIDVLTGPAAGQSRLIQRNTDTTIIPTVNWTVDPVAGATFKIGRPNTSFNSNVLSLGNSGPGTIKLQRFEWGANRFQLFGGFDGRVGGFSTAAILSYGSVTTGETMQARVTYGFSVSDSSSFTFPSLSPAPSMGTSLIGYFTLGGNNNLGVTTHAGGSVLIQGSYIQHLVATDVANINIGFGSRVDTAVFTDCRHVQVLNTSLDFPAIIASTTGYAYTLIGSGSCSPYKSGLVLRNSSLALGDKVYFPQNTGHAIECERSFLILSGNLSGSGHTNFALYAHTNSTVLVGASTPTGVTSILSGSKGYITTDGIIQATDWSTVYGGVIYTDLNELVLIKKQEHL